MPLKPTYGPSKRDDAPKTPRNLHIMEGGFGPHYLDFYSDTNRSLKTLTKNTTKNTKVGKLNVYLKTNDVHRIATEKNTYALP